MLILLFTFNDTIASHIIHCSFVNFSAYLMLNTWKERYLNVDSDEAIKFSKILVLGWFLMNFIPPTFYYLLWTLINLLVFVVVVCGGFRWLLCWFRCWKSLQITFWVPITSPINIIPLTWRESSETIRFYLL